MFLSIFIRRKVSVNIIYFFFYFSEMEYILNLQKQGKCQRLVVFLFQSVMFAGGNAFRLITSLDIEVL